MVVKAQSDAGSMEDMEGVGEAKIGRMQVLPRRQEESTHCPNPFLAVAGWELRRIAAGRGTWVAGGAAFILFVLIVLLLRDSQSLSYGQPQFNSGGMTRADYVRVAGTSAWGMTITMPKYLLLILGLFITFLTADGVAHDFRRRTHEMLMSTLVPTWAYVAGRYAAVLLVSLGFTLLMLAAAFTVGLILSIWFGYPAPNVAASMVLWAVAVLPAIVLLSGLSFTLGTLWPRYSNAAKSMLVVLWVVAQFSAALWEHEQSPYMVIDPAAVVMTQVIQGPYMQTYTARISTLAESLAAQDKQGAEGEQVVRVPREQALQIVREVEQMMPEFWPWVLPRLAYAALGIAAVGLVTARFKRFRNA